MSDEGYRRRIAFIESVADGYFLGGRQPEERCRAMMAHCSQCVEADYYDLARPPASRDPWIREMLEYFDRLFAGNHPEIYSYA